MSSDLTRRKIFPRNLTARADVYVRGNPITTRPESGVENCYPGLEFDQRNLDKRFFEGLVFEFHAGPGFVRAIGPRVAGDVSLTEDDLVAGVYLWALYGHHGREQADGTRAYALDVSQMEGLQCWRHVHDLEHGAVAVLLGPARGDDAPPLSPTVLAEFGKLAAEKKEVLRRNDDGVLEFAILCGQRRRYVDADGVIDVEAYEPGDLTRSLCAPWQYDFRDCGCFYWASNKPDIVAVAADQPQIANFQRKPGSPSPTAPVRSYRDWVQGEYSYTDMILGWERLASVVDLVEAPAYSLSGPVQLPPADVLSRQEIVRRLHYLATVEHGLMVEYLYAHYSVKAPPIRPLQDGLEQWLYDASRIVLSVAIDEMRHLRWINEILRELGEPPELGRVDNFEDFDGDQRTLAHKFGLLPLTKARLDWFIAVESPSRILDASKDPGTVDGLYTRILLSISQSTEFSEIERQRLVHLIKVVIDEGYDHFTRFKRVRGILEGISEHDYLQLPANPTPVEPDHAGRAYQELADNCYTLVLNTLRHVFAIGGVKISEMLSAARYAMYALDDAAKAATKAGAAPLFSLPRAADVTWKSMTTVLSSTAEQRRQVNRSEVDKVLAAAARTNDEKLTARLQSRYENLLAALAKHE